MSTTKRIHASGLIAATLFVSSFAAVRPAQAKLGEGIAIGDSGRLKLGLDLGGRFDNSVNGTGDIIGKIDAKLRLNVKNDSLSLDLGGNVGWNQYAGLPKGSNVAELSFLSAGIKGELGINRDRPIGFTVSEAFARSDSTTNPIFGLGVIALTNHTKARLGFRPGGGAIDLGLSGTFDAAVYNSQTTGATSAACSLSTPDPTACPTKIGLFNSTAEVGMLDAAWRFLPKTGLMLELAGGAQQYAASKVLTQSNVPATPVLANLGFGTLITTRLSFSVKAGYQGIFFASPVAAHQDFDGQIEVSYRFTDSVFARVGAQRNTTPVGSNEHFFTDNRIYLDGFWKIIPTLQLNLTGTTDLIAFGGSEQRFDTSFGANVGVDWTATDWLHVLGGVVFAGRASAVSASSGLHAPSPYSRLIASLGVATMF